MRKVYTNIDSRPCKEHYHHRNQSLQPTAGHRLLLDFQYEQIEPNFYPSFYRGFHKVVSESGGEPTFRSSSSSDPCFNGVFFHVFVRNWFVGCNSIQQINACLCAAMKPYLKVASKYFNRHNNSYIRAEYRVNTETWYRHAWAFQ